MWKHEILSDLEKRAVGDSEEARKCRVLTSILPSVHHVHFENYDFLVRISEKLHKAKHRLFLDESGSSLKMLYSHCMFTFSPRFKQKVAVLISSDGDDYDVILLGLIPGYRGWKIQPLVARFQGGNVLQAYSIYNHEGVEQTQQSLFDLLVEMAAVVHSGLVAIHARNVFLSPHDPPEKLNKKRARKGHHPLFRYHTLRFCPGKVVNKNAQGVGVGKNIGSMPVHLCRGHFMHVTPERPLFGRPGCHGRFWVQAHVRGNKKNGVVVKDYEMVMEEPHAS